MGRPPTVCPASCLSMARREPAPARQSPRPKSPRRAPSGQGRRPRAAPRRRCRATRRLWRSILRRWPKAAWVTLSRSRAVAGSGAARGTSRTSEDVTFGGGTNADGVHVEQYPRLAAPLHQHGQSSVSSSSRARQRCVRRPRAGTSGRRNRTTAATARRVSQRRAKRSRCCRAGWRRCARGGGQDAERGSKVERVGRHDVEPAGIVRRDLLQGGNRPLVALDRDDAGGAERQQRAGESARARARPRTPSRRRAARRRGRCAR